MRIDDPTPIDSETGPIDIDTAVEMSAPTRDDDLYLLVVGKASVRPFPLVHGAVAIGRGIDNTLRIAEDSRISRRHALLHVGTDAVEIEDFGSRNGTRVGGRRVAAGERCRLSCGDAVTLGDTTLILKQCMGVAGEPASSAHQAFARAVEHDAMERLDRTAARVAAGKINILILGETGVGKDVLAQTIHRLSPRGKRPLLRLNCAALHQTLLESELFGHERGAFTGALQAKPGLLEMADGGTVFLDELGELEIGTQAKLLRVLEDGQVLRLGAVRPRTVDIRFVAATNRDLAADVAQGHFRQDLLFRLAGATFVVPPLRDRPGDIDRLSRQFLDDAARRASLGGPPAFSADAVLWLRRYRWPGNIRELRNVIERAVLLCDGKRITSEHLSGFDVISAASAPVPGAEPVPFASEAPTDPEDQTFLTPGYAGNDHDQRRRIAAALARCAGNQTRAASLLGISRKRLLARLDEYCFSRPRKK